MLSKIRTREEVEYNYLMVRLAKLRFLACSLCSLAMAIPKHNIPQTNETTESLGPIRGSKGGHLHLFTSPKDAEDDFEV